MNDMPGLDFGLGEMADTIRESTERFAREQIVPIAAEIDEKDEFPGHLWPKMGELGLHGITVEEEWGGLGLGYLEHVVAQEEVARASASVGLSYGAHSNLCVNQIRRWGNDEQKRKYLPGLISGEHVGSLAMSEAGAGSDVVSMKFQAAKGAAGSPPSSSRRTWPASRSARSSTRWACAARRPANWCSTTAWSRKRM